MLSVRLSYQDHTARTALVLAVCSLLSFASTQSEALERSGTEKSASSSQAGSVLQAYDQALDEVAERAPCFRWSRSRSKLVVMGSARTIPAAR